MESRRLCSLHLAPSLSLSPSPSLFLAPQVLDGVSFVIEAGQTAAFVGPSGSGAHLRASEPSPKTRAHARARAGGGVRHLEQCAALQGARMQGYSLLLLE